MKFINQADNRIYNFSAGPAMLPYEVMQQAHQEFMDWEGRGVSPMEVSHRGKDFLEVVEQTEHDLRELLSIPAHYRVLFMHGGAQTQFAAVPLNLLGDMTAVDYAQTGLWSKKAISEASRYCDVKTIANVTTDGGRSIAPPSQWSVNSDSAYCFMVSNETVDGFQVTQLPTAGDVPIVADMSSDIMSRPIQVDNYGMIFAGAQKNIGPAGVTLVIIREDLLGRAHSMTPTTLNYQAVSKANSLVNTPCTYSWYMVGLVMKWIKACDGLASIEKANQQKAQKLYDYIDESHFYNNDVANEYRSVMNVTFHLSDPEQDSTFVSQAASVGLANLKGHRIVGGMRASLYNAMPESGVDALIEFMREFEKGQ